MHTTAMLFSRFTARIKRIAHKISTLAQSVIFRPHCESVHTGNTALSMRCRINRKTLLSQCFQQERKVQRAVGVPRRPCRLPLKKTIHNLRGLLSTLCGVLIRLACAELRPGRSKTYSPAWFRLRLAHKLEGRYGRTRPKRNAWPVHILAALIFRASFDRSGRDG